MNDEIKQKIALFRFQVIAPLLSVSKDNRGEKEKILADITGKVWELPGSPRTYIGRSTVLEWLNLYEKSARKLSSLYPKNRNDIGRTRAIDSETELSLINLKKQYPSSSIPSIIKIALEKQIIMPGMNVSHVTVYRILKRNNLIEKDVACVKDRRRFETELPNDLWQSDCLHGPKAMVNGKLKKVFLFAFIDDHSRIIPHAQFYTKENIECYMECLLTALSKRGLPRKLYVDNGPYFRSHRLRFTCATLGISLIYAKPYEPEGKGKIERWFRTVRMQFLNSVNDGIDFEELNKKFGYYLDYTYHLAVHSSTGESPISRYTRHVELVRSAPKDLRNYFRIKARRKVENDRTVSLNGKLFEAPINMIGKYIDILYHESDPDCAEAFYDDKSLGALTLLDKHVNSRVKRERKGNYDSGDEGSSLKSGSLF